MASGMDHDEQNGTVSFQRRTILFACVSVLPLLKVGGSAAIGLVTEDSATVAQEQGQIIGEMQVIREGRKTGCSWQVKQITNQNDAVSF